MSMEPNGLPALPDARTLQISDHVLLGRLTFKNIRRLFFLTPSNILPLFFITCIIYAISLHFALHSHDNTSIACRKVLLETGFWRVRECSSEISLCRHYKRHKVANFADEV